MQEFGIKRGDESHITIIVRLIIAVVIIIIIIIIIIILFDKWVNGK